MSSEKERPGRFSLDLLFLSLVLMVYLLNVLVYFKVHCKVHKYRKPLNKRNKKIPFFFTKKETKRKETNRKVE